MKYDIEEMRMISLRNRRVRAVINMGALGLLAMFAALGLAMITETLGEVLTGMVFASSATGSAVCALDAYRVNRSITLAENAHHGK